jgi:nicotinamide mononucleotide transporter
MSIYGWYNWLQKKDADHLAFPIRWCARRERVAGLVLFAGVWLVLWAVLDRLTNSNTPVLDSLVSASAVTAMWWMATRKIENWLAWIFSNVVAIPLNYYKGLMLFTLMYLLFLILAVWGYIDWKKQVQKG